jgi:type IV pilus assembly protein PilE
MKTQTTSKGFTLIELMIVVAIIAVLAAIAIPSYENYVRTTRRSVATGCVQEMAQQMERRFTTNLNYNTTTTLPSLGCVTPIASFYDFAFDAGEPTVNTYKLVATPQGGQANDGCGTLTLNEKGSKNASGNPDVTKCWK